MNIWILGGTGFIGRAIIGQLAADPKNLIQLLLHKRKSFREFESFNTFTGNILSIDRVWFERYPPDLVFHLARPAGSTFLTRTVASNLGHIANSRLVSIFSSLPSPPVVIYVSGSLVYGQISEGRAASEKSKLQPASYAQSYFANEIPWKKAREKGVLDVRFARPGWITGPGSWFKTYFWDVIQNTGRVPCYGTGQQLMSVIHLDDGAAMINTLGMYGQPGHDLNIFSGHPITQEEFSEALALQTGKKIKLIPYPEIVNMYGQTTATALTTSIPLSTLYPDLHQKTNIKHLKISDLLADVVRSLKSKEGVFTQ